MAEANSQKRRIRSTFVLGSRALLVVILVGGIIWALSGFGLFTYQPLAEAIKMGMTESEVNQLLRDFPRTQVDRPGRFRAYQYFTHEGAITIVFNGRKRVDQISLSK